jgi:hypothetical protein
MGVTVLEDADTGHFATDIQQWLERPKPSIVQPANDVQSTLERLFALAERSRVSQIA